MNLERAIDLAKKFIGDEIIDLAFKAETPSKAGKLAEWLGYSRDAVQAAHATASIIRDQGREFALRLLGPIHNQSELPVSLPMVLEIKILKVDGSGYDNPNPSEVNSIYRTVRNALAKEIAVCEVIVKESSAASCTWKAMPRISKI
jgi:hypothetical protein